MEILAERLPAMDLWLCWLYYRGIELRRHDCPEFLKEFQERLMEMLFEPDCAEKVEKEQFKKAYDYVVKTCDEIMTHPWPPPPSWGNFNRSY